MKKTYVIVAFCFLLIGCKKEFPPEFDLESLYPELIGEWTWKRTIYINGPFPEIPETTDPTLDYCLVIMANGAVQYYQDGFLIHARYIKNFNREFESVENGTILTRLYFDLHTYLNDHLYDDGDLMLISRYINNAEEIRILDYPFAHFDHPVYGEIPARNIYERK